MSDKTAQIKKKTVKELTVYTEALENRLIVLENIMKSIKVDPKQLEQNVRDESENAKKMDKLEKRINSIDKKVKNIEPLKLDTHRKAEQRKNKCSKCAREFSDLGKLKEHIVSVHPLTIKCRFCEETFDQTWKLEKHIKIHVEKRFECEKCGQKFHLKWRLMKHKEVHQSENGRFCHYFNNCQECPFQELGCMFRHELSPTCKYMSSCNRKLCQYQHKIVNEPIHPTNQLKCPQCETKTDSETLLKEHINSKHGSNKYDCSVCDKTLESENEFKDHKETNHKIENKQEKHFPCEKCFYSFNSEETYKRHLTGTEHNIPMRDSYDDDSDDEDYSDDCRYCGAIFTTYEAFDNHQSSYLQCEDCKVCFHNEFQWDEHENCERH